MQINSSVTPKIIDKLTNMMADDFEDFYSSLFIANNASSVMKYHEWFFLANEYLRRINSNRISEFEFYYDNNDENIPNIKEFVFKFFFNSDENGLEKNKVYCMVMIQYYIVKYSLDQITLADIKSSNSEQQNFSFQSFTVNRANKENLEDYLIWFNCNYKYLNDLDVHYSEEFLKLFINFKNEENYLINEKYCVFYNFMRLCDDNCTSLFYLEKNMQEYIIRSQFTYIDTIKKIDEVKQNC